MLKYLSLVSIFGQNYLVAKLKIQHGNPLWLSPSIIPSRDAVISPNSSPNGAVINVNSTDIFVYVKVENPGTLDFGTCACSATTWPLSTNFSGYLATNPANNPPPYHAPNGLTTFTASSTDNLLTGNGINMSFGPSVSGKRAWAWSPDGKYFAYVSSLYGSDWNLTIIALQIITRSNGTTIATGQIAASSSGSYGIPSPYWTSTNFSWAGSKAVISSGFYAGGPGITRSLTCPESSIPSWTELIPDTAGHVDWMNLVSPCESVVAFVPKVLHDPTGLFTAPYFSLVSTANAQPVPFRSNNASINIQGTWKSPTGTPSIKTVMHAATGVNVDPGNGTDAAGNPTATMVHVDDPDCTLVGGGVKVRVDRVKASTLPTANLGVKSIGTGTLGILLRNGTYWVQVPNQNMVDVWKNQGEEHWCLLAQAYTSDGMTIPLPWNWPSNPSPFPNMNDNCAQKNIEIST